MSGPAAVARLVAATDPSSTPVTQWPARLLLTFAVLAVIALACWGMWRGWAARGRRQSMLVEPSPLPVDFTPSLVTGVDGRYLASTTAGDWLDRVVAHGLGAPSRCSVSVGEAGILFAREGAPDLYVPRADLIGVRADRGIAGAVFEQGGVLVITWRLGGTSLDTGFRPWRTDDNAVVAGAVQSLLDAAPRERPVSPAAPGEGDPR